MVGREAHLAAFWCALPIKKLLDRSQPWQRIFRAIKGGDFQLVAFWFPVADVLWRRGGTAVRALLCLSGILLAVDLTGAALL
jgi:hypothetical protein